MECDKVKAISTLIISLLTSLLADGRIIHVRSDKEVTTLRRAIEVAQAGDTILLGAGIYKEGNVVIEKSIRLIGEGNPILDGEKKYEILTIRAHHVLIQGLTLKNSGVASITDIAAIKVANSRDVQILNNNLVDTFFAVHFSNSADCMITGNRITSVTGSEFQRGNGIHLWKCRNIAVDANIIRGHRDGIYFEFVTHSMVTNNRSEENLRYGLHFMFSHNDEYRRNIFANNGAGVAVMYTEHVIMKENRFEDNWGASAYGLLLKDIRDSFIERNQFSRNTTAVFMEGSSRCSFTSNVFSRNGWAVKIQANCDNNSFSRNSFMSNTFDVATNGSLVLNKLDHNYWDTYAGYDLDHDGVGDVPHRPVSLYSMVVERMPVAIMLWRSFLVHLLDRTERVVPSVIPEALQDSYPLMKSHDNYL